MHFSELMPNFFLRENGQNTKILKSTILQGAQSIDSERFFKVKGRNEERRDEKRRGKMEEKLLNLCLKGPSQPLPWFCLHPGTIN